MQELVLHKNAIMNFDFQDARIVSEHFHQNVELLYVLEGKVTLKVGKDEFLMKNDDFVVINTNAKHAYHSEGEVLTALLHINYSILSNIIDMSKVMFYCNTVRDRNDAYGKIRILIRKIFNQYYDKNGNALIYLNSLYYSVLHTMTANFIVKNDEIQLNIAKDANEKRVSEIYSYINANYYKSISLDDLSKTLYLSNTYISKYIKKKFGMNFIDYVKSVRLSHVTEEMKYSVKSIMQIAMDNGFSNITAFNKAFKDTYHLTPSAYMEKLKKEKVESQAIINSKPEVLQKVQEYLDNNSIHLEVEDVRNDSYLVVNSRKRSSYNKPWKRMINIGLITDLLRSDMQDHILILKKELEFEYVRFWDVYSPEIYLDITSHKGTYNFAKMDRIFDFLVDNKIKLYIELGFKPIILLKNTINYMLDQKREILFQSLEEYKKFLQTFVSHYINRYGMEEVEKWYFEQWNDPRLDISNDHHEYFEYFETAYIALKSICPNIRIGGAGFTRSLGKITFREAISLWMKRKYKPDFISLYCYPYIIDEQENKPCRSQDPNFNKNFILMTRDVLQENNSTVSELHVSEWNSTVSNRNFLNDSCFKGAYIVKNIIDNIDNVELMGYWIGSDLFSEYNDSSLLLSGSGGLLTKDGIKKPAFYAFDFLNRLGKFLLGKNENSIITSNAYDNYSIVCHNYKHYNLKYYSKDEYNIEIRRLNQLFIDNEALKLCFQINNVKNGTYHIKIRSLNHENGSVQDEWLRMGLSHNLNKDDINYLKQICTPRISIRYNAVEDSTLIIETVLQPNEIQYIHIIYQI